MRYVYARETHSGESIVFNAETGHVVKRSTPRETMRFDEPHPQWTITGAYEARPFGRFRFIPLADFLSIDLGKNGERLFFGNGRPRFHLGDRDHGTLRMHGAGIVAICPVDGAR
jgi:hypothetical protein